MNGKRISALKAIRLKCLDCCCGSSNEVNLCTAVKCPLHPFREGHDPFRAKREYTPEQKAALSSRLAKIRPTNTGEKFKNYLSEG